MGTSPGRKVKGAIAMKSGMRWLIGVVLLVAVAVAASYAGCRYVESSNLAAGEAALEQQQYAKARVILQRFRWNPFATADSRGRHDFLLAMSYFQDIELSPRKASENAVPLLEQVPPNSQYYPAAQLALAKHWFLSLAMPLKAERLLKTALHLEPELLEAKDLLFSIYAANNNPVAADQIFWQSIDQAPDDQKGTRFQQWFCSQFTRNSANQQLDALLDIVDSRGEEFTVFNRLVLFKNQEPDEGAHFGSLADWWLAHDETKTAVEVLAKGREVAKDISNRTYFSSLTDSLLRDGSMAKVERALSSWPEKQRFFKYWRNKGMMHQAENQFADALTAYLESTKYWPSNVDPNLYYRIHICHKELGQAEASEAALKHSETIRYWMEERWGDVGRSMYDLESPESRATLIEFYDAIGRQDAVAFLKNQKLALPATQEKPANAGK